LTPFQSVKTGGILSSLRLRRGGRKIAPAQVTFAIDPAVL